MLCILLTTLPCQLTKPGGSRKDIKVVFGRWRYDGDRERFQSNQAGPCAPSPAPCALCLAPSDSKHSISCGHAWKARNILLRLCHSSATMCSNFEMMSQKTHSLARDPSHLATPFIGAHRSRGVSHPVASHSFLVCSPSLAEMERGPVLWFSPEDQTPNATGFVHAPQRPDDRKFGSSRVLQINLPPPALSIRSRRPGHRPR